MNKFDTLVEEWVDSMKLYGDTVELFVNPTSKELSDISKSDPIRGYLHPSGDIYVISNNDIIHSDLMKALKKFNITLPKSVLNVVDFGIDGVYGAMTDASPKSVGLLIDIYYGKVEFSESYFDFGAVDQNEWMEEYGKDLKAVVSKSQKKNKGLKFNLDYY